MNKNNSIYLFRAEYKYYFHSADIFQILNILRNIAYEMSLHNYLCDLYDYINRPYVVVTLWNLSTLL